MFSSDSRWDRHTPDKSYDEQPIDVGAVFLKGKMSPQNFVWKNRKYLIKEITYEWKESRGNQLLHYFSVSDGSNLYLVYFNAQHVCWRLTKVCPLE